MTSRITPNSVFLVSGGARGITARCVVVLAQRYHCKFILLGRTAIDGAEPGWAQGTSDEAEMKRRLMAEMATSGEKPTPVALNKRLNAVLARREIAATLADIRAAGGQAEYLAVDVTDVNGLLPAVRTAETKLGRVTAILHGAGNLADKRIEQKTEADFEAVYAAKVRGLENLLACVDADALDTLILFSSVAGFYGNIGQADYALANEVLNKTAYRFQRHHPRCRVVSINWGPWDAGMVTPELKRLFAERGVNVIPIEEGAALLVEELERPDTSAQIVVGSGLVPGGALHTDALQTHRLTRRLSLAESPFLGDHVVNGVAVLPMVSAMSWMANAAEGRYPGYHFFSFADYKVLKGILFDETLAASYTLQLKETRKDGERIEFDAMISSETSDGKPRFHYSASLTLLRQRPERPVFPRMDLTVREDIDGAGLYENYTLFHGQSFRGVERVLNIDPKRVTMRCVLPVVDEKTQGQFPVGAFNYFMVDIGFQSMGTYARHFYDAGSLPLRASGGEFYADVAFGGTFYVTLEIRSASETGLVTDLFIHDAQGQLYGLIAGGEITISKRLNELFKRNRLPEAPTPLRQDTSY